MLDDGHDAAAEERAAERDRERRVRVHSHLVVRLSSAESTPQREDDVGRDLVERLGAVAAEGDLVQLLHAQSLRARADAVGRLVRAVRVGHGIAARA